MGRPRKTKPDGFLLYAGTLRLLRIVPEQVAGKAIQAGAAYFMNGTDPPAPVDFTEQQLFESLVNDIDSSLEKFRATCEKNKAIADSRYPPKDESAPVVTNGNQSAPIELNGTEPNQIYQNVTDQKPVIICERERGVNNGFSNIHGQDAGKLPPLKGRNLDG